MYIQKNTKKLKKIQENMVNQLENCVKTCFYSQLTSKLV